MQIIFYTIFFIALTIYSYTQIDLNLTLSSNPLYQTIQNQLIQIGYFNRPISTFIFISIILLSVIGYLISLQTVQTGKLKKIRIILIIGLSTGFLLFAYSAFSHDLFNYLFDARIVTKYGANPYFFKALDFPDDLWIRFMHWTHRTYPYGPVWLFFTLPLSYLGFGKFVFTLFLFKLLFAVIHVGNSLLIFKILNKISPKKALFGLVFYALNPLILIESMVSPHLDSLMLLFLLISIYFLLVKKKYLLSIIAVIISGLIKFVTLPLLVIFFLYYINKRLWTSQNDRKNNTLHAFLIINFIVLLISLLIPIFQREPYPWYFIPLIGVGTLLVDFIWLQVLLVGLSIGLLLRYAPFLYFGDYSPTVAQWQNIFLIIPLFVSFVYIFIRRQFVQKR